MSDAGEATRPPESPPHTGNPAYSISNYSFSSGRWLRSLVRKVKFAFVTVGVGAGIEASEYNVRHWGRRTA